MAVLEARQIAQSFEGEQIIKDVNITLNEGEIVCLVGSSGVGKSTLFHILSGLEKPDAGQVLLDGEDITGRPGKISYMLQKDLLLPHRTILMNVSLPLIIRGMNRKEAKEKARLMLPEFGLEGTEKKFPAQLSGGMRQRAALLRTYLFSDRVALLDEPFSALDAITKGQMHSWYIRVMEKYKLSTLFVSHDIDEALKLSDRIYVMAGKPGRIVKEIVVDRKELDRESFCLDSEFLLKKKEILNYLG
ncbi:ABC-type nitrate/sulfonate/bicarbonate transport system, ATPase component [Lachnospiraceae bacterium XBB1006]|nr:ABC-type nitrate/sulfonate/bicarbonate transport system, ATPase component [Lachnospiraceae bacterium XBB1006]